MLLICVNFHEFKWCSWKWSPSPPNSYTSLLFSPQLSRRAFPSLLPPTPPTHVSYITNLSSLLSRLLKATCSATWVTPSSRRASWAVRITVVSSTSAPPSSHCRTCCCPTRRTFSASWCRSGKRRGPRCSPSASCCGWAQSTDVSARALWGSQLYSNSDSI